MRKPGWRGGVLKGQHSISKKCTKQPIYSAKRRRTLIVSHERLNFYWLSLLGERLWKEVVFHLVPHFEECSTPREQNHESLIWATSWNISLFYLLLVWTSCSSKEQSHYKMSQLFVIGSGYLDFLVIGWKEHLINCHAACSGLPKKDFSGTPKRIYGVPKAEKVCTDLTGVPVFCLPNQSIVGYFCIF